MAVKAKEQRWVELRDLLGVPLSVSWERVDYGGGPQPSGDRTGVHDGLAFSVPNDVDAGFGSRQRVIVGLDDLRELVRLADEEPEKLRG